MNGRQSSDLQIDAAATFHATGYGDLFFQVADVLWRMPRQQRNAVLAAINAQIRANDLDLKKIAPMMRGKRPKHFRRAG